MAAALPRRGRPVELFVRETYIMLSRIGSTCCPVGSGSSTHGNGMQFSPMVLCAESCLVCWSFPLVPCFNTHAGGGMSSVVTVGYAYSILGDLVHAGICRVVFCLHLGTCARYSQPICCVCVLGADCAPVLQLAG